MEQVQVCRFCGHIGPIDDGGRCVNCQSFSGLTSIPRADAERLSRRRKFTIRRSRYLPLGLALAVVIGLVVWLFWDYLGLTPDPDRPASNLGPPIEAQSWPQVRRTGQGSGFTPEPAPDPHEVKWSFATNGPLLASPAVVGDRVYLTTEDGRALALDRRTGLVVWEYRSGYPSSSTPAVVDRFIIFAIRPGVVLALDRDTGALRWERDLESPVLASPVVRDGTVYIGAGDNKLYALDVVTGEELWNFKTDDWVIAPVAFAEDSVIVASKDNLVHVVDTDTGRRRLVYDTGRRRQVLGGPATKDHLVFFGSQRGRVWAVDSRSRTLPWDRFVLFWQTNFHVWGWMSQPPVQRGSVWGSQVDGDVAHTPAVADNAIYVASVLGTVTALGAATGDRLWSTHLGSQVTAAPTVAGTTVLVGVESGIVFALDSGTGEVIWDFETGDKITGSPIVAEGMIYIVSHDGSLYAIGATP